MEKILSVLRKPAKLVLMILVGVYALFEFLYAVGVMDNGDEGAIAGGFFFLIFFFGLVAALIFALVKKNDKAARLIGIIFFGFLALRILYGFLGGVGYGSEIGQAVYAFDFLAALSAMAILVIFILKTFIEKLKDNKVLDIVCIACLGGYLFFSLLARLLEFGVYADIPSEYVKYYWYIIIGNVGDIVLLGVVLFGYILLFTKEKANEKITAEESGDTTEEVEEPVQDADEDSKE